MPRMITVTFMIKETATESRNTRPGNRIHKDNRKRGDISGKVVRIAFGLITKGLIKAHRFQWKYQKIRTLIVLLERKISCGYYHTRHTAAMATMRWAPFPFILSKKNCCKMNANICDFLSVVNTNDELLAPIVSRSN